jgi:hypothetical protein
VDKLTLQTEPASPVRVKVANGEFMLSSRRVEALVRPPRGGGE